MARGVNTDFLEELKSKNEIVDIASKYMTLNRRGDRYWACCPFHHEKTPSFSIKQDGQFYKCFGCGEGGDVINLVMKMENVEFMTAVEMMAKSAGMQLPSDADNEERQKIKRNRDKMYSILRATTDFYQNNLKNAPNSAQARYLNSRGINADMIAKFQIGASLNYDALPKHLESLGFKPDDMIMAGVVGRNEKGSLYDFYGSRLIFPIFNGFGDVVAYSGRSVDDNSQHAKYKNTTQTLIFNKSETLFAYNFVRDLKKEQSLDTIVIVEGHIDVIMCHQAGITNTIGCMGTALTPQHARNVKRLVDNVILCLDGDSAGNNATYKAIDMLKEVGLNVKVVRLVGAKDPDEYLKKFGKDAYYEMLATAQDCVDFVLLDSAKKYNMQSNNDKTKYVAEALNYISKFSTPAEREIYLTLVQRIVQIPIDALRNSLVTNNIKPKLKEEDVEISELGSNKAIIESKIMLLASVLYKKIKNLDEVAGIFVGNDELSELYRFFIGKMSENRDFNASTLFDNFDINNNSLIDKVINYVFPPEEVYDTYLKDTIITVKRYEFESEKASLQTTLKSGSLTDINEQMNILKRIQELDRQIKELK